MQNYDDVHVEYYDNRKVKRQMYLLDGVVHRLDGPAWISFLENGKRSTEVWYINGAKHRLGGPAFVICYQSFNSQHVLGNSSFYLDDKYYTEGNYKRIIQEVVSMPLALRLTDPRWWVRELKEEDIAKLR